MAEFREAGLETELDAAGNTVGRLMRPILH
jgi:hypothetical protein